MHQAFWIAFTLSELVHHKQMVHLIMTAGQDKTTAASRILATTTTSRTIDEPLVCTRCCSTKQDVDYRSLIRCTARRWSSQPSRPGWGRFTKGKMLDIKCRHSSWFEPSGRKLTIRGRCLRMWWRCAGRFEASLAALWRVPCSIFDTLRKGHHGS